MKAKILSLKTLEKLFTLFPPLHFLIILVSLIFFIKNLELKYFLFFVGSIYFLPLLVWRALFLQIKEGKQSLGKNTSQGSSWLIAHYLQYIFITFPMFERVLIIFPGLYSFWLRLWGSKIGKGVIWNPVMALHDRSLVEIGDYCIIGGHTHIASHFLVRQHSKLNSYVKKVTIGNKVIVGAESSLGPGATLIDGTLLPPQSRALLGRIERGEFGKTNRT